MSRNILIIGATGKQGRATIKALLALPPSPSSLRILALTRNVKSTSARALSELHPSAITLVRGDLASPGAVFAQEDVKNSVSSLYFFTIPGTKEDVIGKAWIDTAVENGVSQIVLSTVDRGGERSWDNPTDVPPFAKKHVVEIYLRDKAAKVAKAGGPKIYWTILRPTAFMDSMNPGPVCGLLNAAWATLPEDKPLQFISTHDIGVFAAKAITAPEEWDQKAIALAGDDLTQAQAKEIFARVVGKPMPQSWDIIGNAAMLVMPDMRKMFTWFGQEGYDAEIETLKKIEPQLQDLETWLRKSSKWRLAK